ncbi:MAG: aminotransferase class I/II-fold pyridoxal phosphate-dependent enzyme [Candidatus Methanoperedens sp.]|nr:aminotransferase class I/II-fold pyridoxal phosphate-dependent enzyme [Candidatus Methanoperedens sp.]
MPDINSRIRKTALAITPCVHGARVAESAEESGIDTSELLDFSVNLNPLGPPPAIPEVLANACKSVENYPDNRYPGFRKAAAQYLDVSPLNIVPGNGSSEIIRLFAETVIEPGDGVILPMPTFGEYGFQCRLFGAEIEYVDYKEITEVEPGGYKAVFVCNPNNPTGSLVEREKVIELAKKCSSSGTFLFVDEAFIELSDPGQSIAGFAASNDFVIVLRSLTKVFAVAGLRIGYAVTSPAFANVLNSIRLPWSLNSVAVSVGEWLFGNHEDYINTSLALISEEREWLMEKLVSVRGFSPYPGDVNYILVDIGDFFMGSEELARRMLENGIIIRECSSFGLVNHIRIAVRKREDNEELLDVITSVINQKGNEMADEEIGRVLERGVTARSRIDCEYYPCHFKGQDCTFCFCPFYPCGDERTGGRFVERAAGGSVWSCATCHIIHKGDIAEKVLKALMSGKSIKEVWEEVLEPEL